MGGDVDSEQEEMNELSNIEHVESALSGYLRDLPSHSY